MATLPYAAAANLPPTGEPIRESGSLGHYALLVVVTVLAFSPVFSAGFVGAGTTTSSSRKTRR